MHKPNACDCEMIAILTCMLSSFLANLAYLTAPLSCSAFLHELITASVFSIIFHMFVTLPFYLTHQIKVFH